jgi:hypothetical protein
LIIKKIKLVLVRIFYFFSPAILKKQLVNFRILAESYGQYKTIRQMECLGSDGSKIPWYTYPAIEYLNGIDFSEKIIFEYGSGNSSAYWAKKARSIFSVEHDKEWYSKIKNELADNQVVTLCETEEMYLNSIQNFPNKVDVIIIDGKHREKCAKQVREHLSETGIVILDNADWYKATSKYFREELDLIEVDFHGFGPINSYTWTTSIFFTRSARLKPINNVQPHYSIAAKKNGDYEKFI